MKRTVKHGATRNKVVTTEFKIWAGMLDRCFRSRNPAYKLYGARGIVACERWLKFENFLADMGHRPAGLSLDRIDNDGDYEPGNCRWATQKEQMRNMRNNRLITFQGETAPLCRWAEKTGIKRESIARRLAHGWSVERTLTEKIGTAQ